MSQVTDGARLDAASVRALIGPVPVEQVLAFRRAHLSEVTPASSTGTHWTTVVTMVGLGFLVVAPLADFFLPRVAGQPRPSQVIAYVVWAIALVALLAVAASLPARRYGAWRRRLALARFAEVRGWLYRTERRPGPVGVVFGDERLAMYDCIRGSFALPFEAGNCRGMRTSRKGGTTYTHARGYVTVQLPRRVPHVVLDSPKDGPMNSLGLATTIDVRQRIELEGDFGRYFRVFCPAGYERDILYLLTPDVMARLVDLGSRWDIELVDDRAHFVAARPLDLRRPTQWDEIARLVDGLAVEIADRASRYADSGVGSRELDRIAKAGARLRAPVLPTVLTGLAVAAVIAYAVWDALPR